MKIVWYPKYTRVRSSEEVTESAALVLLLSTLTRSERGFAAKPEEVS